MAVALATSAAGTLATATKKTYIAISPMTRIQSQTRREVSAREVVLLAVAASVLSVVMSWPLLLHLGDAIPRDLGDPQVQAWEVAWDGYALVHQPLHFFDANRFWPFGHTLAFSDGLVGYTPAGLLGSGPHAAVVRYDLLFLFAYALAFAGGYLLARELGLGPAGASVCGAAFAFAPFRLEQDGHMNVISSGGIPLALALGVRGYRLRRARWVIAGFAVATWQLSLGFTLGLPLAYLLAALGVIAAIAWWRRGRPSLDRRLGAATVCGALLFCAVGFGLSRPYVAVADAHHGARRHLADIEDYSGPPWIFLAAPEENLVWGGATAPIRDDLSSVRVPEETLFPGVVIVALAIAGLVARAYPRWLRWGLGIAVVVFSVLALGFHPEGGLLWPYRVVYEVLPGSHGIRVPGRLVTFSSLALALLAGAGAQLAGSALARYRGGAWGGGALVAGLLVLAIVVEGRGLPFDPTDSQAQPGAPPTPPSVAAIPAPQLHLPALSDGANRRYLLWSTDGFPKIVNGRSSLTPNFARKLVERSRGFPSRHTVALLRRTGVRSVIVHVRRAQGTHWRNAERRPVAGLGLTRSRLGDLIVYRLGSG
jgi:hypothetical protein